MGIIVTETNRLPVYSKAELAPNTLARTANGMAQRKADGEIKRASRRYQAVDPTALAEKLTAAGFRLGKMAHFRSLWKFGWEVIFPEADCGPSADPYYMRAKILCVHNGREAFKVFPGAMRVACLNQFHGEALRIGHCDEELARFLSDPASALYDLRDTCRATVDTVEGFKGLRLPAEYGLVVSSRPRLGASVQDWLRHYRARKGEIGQPTIDAWDMVQALTEVKKPRTIEAASILVRHADALRQGVRVQKYFDLWEPDRKAAPEVAAALAQ